MDILAAINLGSIANTALHWSFVVLGLGLVVFFHELGHFAVAKWCNVHVERFSIGFGPILWARKRGETEYAISAVPFGGYVKMLGQDDMDPSQLSSEEIAEDPRSYSAKSVPQRMAIISAGVIMNIVTGILFFAIAFGVGIETEPSIVGTVDTGSPAWVSGLRDGDQVTEINGREASTFSDIVRAVALSRGQVDISGVHTDGETFDVKITPTLSGTRPMIGVNPTMSTTLLYSPEPEFSVTAPGSAAAAADPPLLPGDTIEKIDGEPIETFAELQDIFAKKAADSVTLTLRRRAGDEGKDGEVVETVVGPNRFRTLGLWMEIGRIAAIRESSPAARAGFEVGDKITHIDGQDVGIDLNPLELPNILAGRAGEEVTIDVKRPVKGATEKDVRLTITPTAALGWTERPYQPDQPLAVPAAGLAFNLIPTVLKVEPGSPAEKAGIEAGERIKKVQLTLPEGAQPDGFKDNPIVIDFAETAEKTQVPSNWASVFWLMQTASTRDVKLDVGNTGKVRTVDLKPVEVTDREWYLPIRGIRTDRQVVPQEADSLVAAIKMGAMHARNSMLDIYLTLRNLVGGYLSYKELRGPLGIAVVAYEVANQGIPELMLFLGFLSVNLAILNFLPIPVLDGGHMVFLCWEAITRKRPSERVLIAATYFGMAFVLGLMLLVLYLDIFVHGMGVS